MTAIGWLEADWPAPAGVRAGVTTRSGGISRGPLAGLNLATHVGDDPERVAANRTALGEALGLPAPPFWLTQVHGSDVAVHPGPGGVSAPPPPADAAVTRERAAVLAILTADCLPVAFASRDGAVLGVAHAGWRGLAGGVLEATLATMAVAPEEVLAWLGPAIEPAAFEVGTEVREAFLAADPGAAPCFAANARGRFQADLAALARRRLARLGVHTVYGGGLGTFGDADRWYSHRREPRSGRMATLLWRV